MKKYLVTGGAGFIGSHIVDRLIEQGSEVVVIDNLSTGKKTNLNLKSRFYNIDIQDIKVSEIFEKERPNVVLHYAAQIDVRKAVKNPIESATTNILGSLNILENCRRFGVKKIVFSSTGGAIYGETEIIPTPEDYPAKPTSPYGIEKLIVENYLNFYKKEYGLDYLILRFANVYGPRQNYKGEAGVVAIFCDKMISEEKIIINGNGKQTRDFIFVNDIVKANILGLEKNKTGVFNIGTGKETDINDVFATLKKAFSFKDEKVYAPQKTGEQQRSCLDFSKAKKELDWMPEYDLEKGIEETKKWFQNNGGK